MSDRALRTRSRSRGRSVRSSPEMPDKYASWYAEESYDDGYRAGFHQGCFTDDETRGYLDGLNSRRMNKAQGDESHDDSTDDERDSTDDEGDDDDREARKGEIMDKIWDLAEDGSELQKLVIEYDNEDPDNDYHYEHYHNEEKTDNEETDEDTAQKKKIKQELECCPMSLLVVKHQVMSLP